MDRTGMRQGRGFTKGETPSRILLQTQAGAAGNGRGGCCKTTLRCIFRTVTAVLGREMAAIRKI